MNIPFVRELEFEYGAADRLSPLVRRVIAKNPSPFTYYGTGTYVIGNGEVAVIDPGPDLARSTRAAAAQERIGGWGQGGSTLDRRKKKCRLHCTSRGSRRQSARGPVPHGCPRGGPASSTLGGGPFPGFLVCTLLLGGPEYSKSG